MARVPESQFADTAAFDATLVHLGFGLHERLGVLIISFAEGIRVLVLMSSLLSVKAAWRHALPIWALSPA